MQVSIETSWQKVLQSEFKKPYFIDLLAFVEEAYQNSICYPKKEQIFAAFNACSFDNVKVVILGQDPYHGPNQANGLCFSVNDGVAHPPSLINIFKEIERDLKIPYPESGNLERWAKQGVLLLNASLTVENGKAGSHQKKGWEIFTDAVIKTINEHKKGIIFLLWGNFAKKKTKLIDKEKHYVLIAGHPSPLSANKGYWFDNHHFTEVNKILSQNNLSKIEW